MNPPPDIQVGQQGAAIPPPPGVVLPSPALEHARRRGRVRTALPLLGPAFVAAVAYVDPGNFATNIGGGARYGFLLVWVIVAANLMAMLVQYLSAKIGIASGRTLPELCREAFPRPVTWGLWLQAEAIAIATDLAEFVGAAIALNLLFGVPPFAAGLMTAAVAFAILALQNRGYRRFELAIAGLLGIVFLGFAYDLSFAGVDPGGLAGGLIPGFDGTDSVLLAVGILGATVMPHVVYLHSALTSNRIPAASDDERRRLLRFQRLDVLLAMGLAGVIKPEHAGRGGRALPRQRPPTGRHDRGRALRARRARRRRRRARVRGRAARLGPVELERRHLRRPGCDAGLHPAPDPALPAARDYDGAGAGGARRRARTDHRPGDLPGDPLLRDPVCARADDPAHAPAPT
jgi:hypothetical protein